MSGSSSTGGGGDPPPRGDCQSLAFPTYVSSPRATQVALITVGTVLDVAAQVQQAVRVVVLIHAGSVLGGIAPEQMDRLLACIDEGYVYQAIVREVDDGNIQVFVRCTGRG